MATVFMRWLERRPAAYDRGIRLLTLGQLDSLYAIIAERVKPGQRVLEIGCGTGGLTRKLAGRGAQIEAIDVSAAMIDAAREKLGQEGLLDQVRFTRLDALALERIYEPASFNMIVASLVFSEFNPPAQEHVLRLCRRLLRPEGSLLILDEVRPRSTARMLLTTLIRAPFQLFTWLLTRTTTHPLKRIEAKLERAGFAEEQLAQVPGPSLALLHALPIPGFSQAHVKERLPRLEHHPTLATRLRDLWALFFRVLPPYPRIEPGLYAIGEPGEHDPVLMTGNYDLTVRRVVRALDGKVSAWLLVVDSSGVNVWCGAGAGFLNAERVVGALQMSGVEAWHATKHLVLPQLCANGVDGNAVRERTGWRVSWGPVRAADIPAYLSNGFQKDERMRSVTFPVRDRLEMVSATLGLYALMILVPVLIFWRQLFWPVLIALLGLSYFYALALPRIPGRDGLAKSLPLSLIALAGMFVFSWFTGNQEPQQLFQRGVGMVALSVFVAAELQGMSPLMRGEQANWGWEALIAIVLGVAYWMVPRLLGWSA